MALVVLAGIGLSVRPRHAPRQPGQRVIGVMKIKAQGDVDPKDCVLTRVKLSTTLSAYPLLAVFSKEKLDFIRSAEGSSPGRGRKLTEIEVAEQLSIDMMIVGTLAASGKTYELLLYGVDGITGQHLPGVQVRESGTNLLDIQARAAAKLVRALGMSVPDRPATTAEPGRVEADVETYRLVNEMMGGVAGETGSAEPDEGPTSLRIEWIGVAHAQSTETDEIAVRDLLERYRLAIQSEDLDTLSALHVDLNAQMRAAFERYFENADELAVEFSDFDVIIDGDDALATFTRRDEFRDARTEQPIEMKIRISSRLERLGDGWRIRGLEKGS